MGRGVLALASVISLAVIGACGSDQPATSSTPLTSSPSIPPTYATDFPLTENPLSEGGKWRHLDPTLTVVRTETIAGVHVAHGTQTGSGGYDDSNAYLTGFSANQVIQGTVWKSPSIS